MNRFGLVLVMAVGMPAIASAQSYPQQSPETAATQEQLDHLHESLEHDRQHQQIEDAHAREHASGFTSQAQHDQYHRELNNLHTDVHETAGSEHVHDDASYANRQAYQGNNPYGDRGYRDQYVQHRTVTRYGHRPYRYGRVHHRTTTTYTRY